MLRFLVLLRAMRHNIALLLYACRKKFGEGKGYRVYGGKWLMAWVFFFGLANVAAQILSRANILPVFNG